MLNEPASSLLEIFLFWYFFFINFIYIVLLLIGAVRIYQRKKEVSVEDFSTILNSNSLPEITFIIPFHNEEKNILSCIKSVLNLSYRYKQIICVNDGSSDETMESLKKELDLVSIPDYIRYIIPSSTATCLYRSKVHPEVTVIDKEHKGKYDAVNLGINACKDPYFISVDADTFLDDLGFEAMIRPILAYPEAIAIGGCVRIKNGCTLEYNRMNTKNMNMKMIPVFQGLEYLRAFLQRQGWSVFNSNFVIAGSFSIFPTDTIRKAGGFIASVAEDMEIIVRLHRIMKENKKKYKIFYLPDPVAWTEGPSSLKKLGNQRANWHFGLLETLYFHKKMFFDKSYGFLGLFVYPFWLFCEALEPLFEAAGYLIILSGILFGYLNISFCLLIIFVTLGFTFLYSLICLLIEELSFKRYTSLKVVLWMFFLSIIENLGYRQLNIYWRIKGFFKLFINFKHTKAEKEVIEKKIEGFKSGS